MACRCSPSLDVLRDQINARWPNRDKASDGCCASSAHHGQNPNSDHEPVNGFAHARDIDPDLGDATDPHTLAEILLSDHRTRYIIFDRHIGYPSDVGHPVNQWKAYHGANAHEHHIHVSIVLTATHDLNLWALPPAEEDDLTPAESKQLADNTAAVARIENTLAEMNAREQRQGLDLGDITEALARLEAKP